MVKTIKVLLLERLRRLRVSEAIRKRGLLASERRRRITFNKIIRRERLRIKRI